jgi:hypothetical protein
VSRFLLLLTFLLATPSLAAQDRVPPMDLQLQGGDGTVRVILGEILENSGARQSLESGLPLRVRIVVELWRDRFVDALEGRHEWRATVLLDPLANRYLVETEEGASAAFASLAGARAFLQTRLQVPLAPSREGRHYYLAHLELETLSLSDLEELRRWLQGDLAPAVQGRQETRGAVGRGLRRLLVRVLGLPVQRYQTRTPTFDH